MADLSRTVLNVEDLRGIAKRRLTRALFDFIDRGSEDDVALRHNREAIQRIKLRPRVMRDVSARDPSVMLLNHAQKLPLVIGPTGPAGFVHYRGEIALARAAVKAGIPFTLAHSSNTPMERVLSEGGGRQWFHLYVWRDMEASLRSVERADRAGFDAVVLTVDAVVWHNREADIRNGAAFPFKFMPRNVIDALLHPRWLFGTLGRYVLSDGHLPRCVNVAMPDNLDIRQVREFLTKNATMTWEFLRRLRKLWPRKLIVKGILHPDDAVMAANCGADAVVVSNHGGNASDASMAPIDALPDVVNAVGDRVAVIVDSGFRRGSDILKALALGAHAVMIGRATLYGLAAAGEAGATRALEILDADIRRTMATLGCSRISELSRDHVVIPPGVKVPRFVSDTGASINAPTRNGGMHHGVESGGKDGEAMPAA
jgi:isopentenyl diphosphate isomerase/L-lactate dehydrogenase-like FMN-dependent dehydrogenase